MDAELPLWTQIVVSLLLLASAVFTLAAAWGVVRLRNFFQRLHPPALAVTWSAWCVSFATIVHFSAQDGQLELRAWVLIILLSITVPITTVLLSRVALFRGRRQSGGDALPAPLHPVNPTPNKSTIGTSGTLPKGDETADPRHGC